MDNTRLELTGLSRRLILPGVKEIITTALVIRSRIGNRVIEWDQRTLTQVIAQLRSERDRHDTEIETAIGEAGHNALMLQAEQIKRETENEINHVRAPT
jgi:hypothetical protein